MEPHPRLLPESTLLNQVQLVIHVAGRSSQGILLLTTAVETEASMALSVDSARRRLVPRVPAIISHNSRSSIKVGRELIIDLG